MNVICEGYFEIIIYKNFWTKCIKISHCHCLSVRRSLDFVTNNGKNGAK